MQRLYTHTVDSTAHVCDYGKGQNNDRVKPEAIAHTTELETGWRTALCSRVGMVKLQKLYIIQCTHNRTHDAWKTAHVRLKWTSTHNRKR